MPVNARQFLLRAVNGCSFVACRRLMAVNSLFAKSTLPKNLANWTHLRSVAAKRLFLPICVPYLVDLFQFVFDLFRFLPICCRTNENKSGKPHDSADFFLLPRNWEARRSPPLQIWCFRTADALWGGVTHTFGQILSMWAVFWG